MDTKVRSTKAEIENVVENAMVKHKLEYDKKLVACVNEIDNVKYELNVVNLAQARLETEVITVRTKVQEIEQAQSDNHNENTLLHPNSELLLKTLLDSNSQKHQENIKPNSGNKSTQPKQPVPVKTATARRK